MNRSVWNSFQCCEKSRQWHFLPIHLTIFKERNSHCNFFKKYISGRESFKDTHSLHLPNERFSPVRRASDSLTSMNKYQTHLEKIYNLSLSTPSSRHNSLKQLQKECQQLSVSVLERCGNLLRKLRLGPSLSCSKISSNAWNYVFVKAFSLNTTYLVFDCSKF